MVEWCTTEVDVFDACVRRKTGIEFKLDVGYLWKTSFERGVLRYCVFEGSKNGFSFYFDNDTGVFEGETFGL